MISNQVHYIWILVCVRYLCFTMCDVCVICLSVCLPIFTSYSLLTSDSVIAYSYCHCLYLLARVYNKGEYLTGLYKLFPHCVHLINTFVPEVIMNSQ